MGIIDIKNLVFEYIRRDEEGNTEEIERAIDGVELEVNEGDFIAILGHNGSGKSTLAKHLNALLVPTEGTVWVNGYDTRDVSNLLNIRQSAGMVFQNPDNQIIASVVEEDVGFGGYAKHSPNKLSGGQKQRVAIAGIMVMKPKCIVLDEPTAMLDPIGRKEVLKTVHKLNKNDNITIILITHYMDEVIDADKIFVMEEGKVVLQGTPREVFSEVERLESYRLDVPQVTKLAYELKQSGVPIDGTMLTVEEFREAIKDVTHSRSY